MTVDSRVDLADYDLFSPQIQQCPWPWFTAMRDQAPVFPVDMDGRPIWLVTTYDLCLEVITDPFTFSSKFGTPGLPPSPEMGARMKALRAEHGAYRFVPTLLTADPPQHSRYRKLVARAFSPRSTAALEPSVRALARSLMDRWPEPGEVDYVSSFAGPFPLGVIAAALNVPERDLPDFKRWSDDTMAAQGSAISDERRLEAELGIIEFQKYFAARLAERRTDPQDDLLTHLVEATIDPTDPDAGGPDPVVLNDAEILSILQQILVAGNETTTKALAEMVLLLANSPDTYARARTDAEVRTQVVEEALRLGTPGLAMWRVATKEVQLGGVLVPQGARLLVVYGSANRDRQAFPAGDGFCPERADRNHIAFGKGSHFCLGSHLARLEMRVALEELTDRYEQLDLAQDNELRYTPSFMLRGLEALHLRLERPA